MSGSNLTRAQARELRAWVRHGKRPDRPMTVWKLQRLGLVDSQERLTSAALVAVDEMEERPASDIDTPTQGGS